jgi:hypothetical protein
MNGLDEFAEAAVGIFVIICGLMMLLTRLESTLDEEPVSKPPTIPDGQAKEASGTATEDEEGPSTTH